MIRSLSKQSGAECTPYKALCSAPTQQSVGSSGAPRSGYVPDHRDAGEGECIGGVAFDKALPAPSLGTLALALVLFDGGLQSPMEAANDDQGIEASYLNAPSSGSGMMWHGLYCYGLLALPK